MLRIILQNQNLWQLYKLYYTRFLYSPIMSDKPLLAINIWRAC